MRHFRNSGFSLIEVTLAVAIVSFCLIAILGLFPVGLNALRDSQEKAVMARIYQSMPEELSDKSPGELKYSFDSEGFPVKPGTAGMGPFYQVIAAGSVTAVPESGVNPNLMLWRISIVHVLSGATRFERAIYVAR